MSLLTSIKDVFQELDEMIQVSQYEQHSPFHICFNLQSYQFFIGNVLLFSYKDQFLLQLIGFPQKEALRFSDFDCLDNYQYAFIVDVLIC